MPVHAAVPGRARLSIRGLRGNDALRRRIERILPDGEIRSVDASTLTGNLLVRFDQRVRLAEIRERMERVLTRLGQDAPAPTGDAGPAVPVWHAASAADILRAF